MEDAVRKCNKRQAQVHNQIVGKTLQRPASAMSHRTSPPRSQKKKRPQSSLGFRPTVIPTAEVGPAEFHGKWSPPRRRVEEPAEEDGGLFEIYRRSSVSRDRSSRSASPGQPRSPSPQHVAPPPSPTAVHGGGLSPRFATMREGYVSSTSGAADGGRALGESLVPLVPLSDTRRSSPHPQPLLATPFPDPMCTWSRPPHLFVPQSQSPPPLASTPPPPSPSKAPLSPQP